MAVTLLVLCSCSNVYRYTESTFFSMSTFVTVISDDENAGAVVERQTREYEKKLSRTVDSSEISILNKNGSAKVSEETALLLNKSLEIAKNTQGTFNPCLASVVSLWDITSGKDYVPDDEKIMLALKHTDYNVVTVDGDTVNVNDARVDLGAIAKGYILGQVMNSAKESGAKNICISLGGNVGVCGSSASRQENGLDGWSVGITNPFNKEQTLGNIVLCDSYISVSGAYERYFEKDGEIYHHIFDSSTGKPAKSDIASSCVVSEDAALGDALSTALFVMGSEKAVQLYNSGIYEFEMILIMNDKRILVTDGLKDDFVVTDKNFLVIDA
ncbi:MAG: FAD:protein FMN transferase [Clostridia bacterium]|nr:FAD:protein FMN transferase [Clostridia bacterium]